MKRQWIAGAISAAFLMSPVAMAQDKGKQPEKKKDSVPMTPIEKAPEPKPDQPEKKAKPDEGGKPAAAVTTLKVGDKAPALAVETWVKGTEVKQFEPGKVYVVEFWATWCGPCIASIPHLTELQQKHGEKLVVIGMASSERMGKEGEDKRLQGVKDFVAKQGDKMAYRVAFDPKRDMATKWLVAAGMKTIPTAFVVDGTGTVTYIGHPKEMDKAVEEALKKAGPKA